MISMIALPRKFVQHLPALLVGYVLLTTTAANAEGEGADDGLYITVQNPITDAANTQIKNTIDRARNQQNRRIKKIVFDFNPGGAEAATPNFGSCSDLAAYIVGLSKNNGITTIAFVHGKTTRHTVLPALACVDLIMSQNAQIGEVVGPNELPEERHIREYAEIAGRTKEAVVRKMLDKNVEVVEGTDTTTRNVIYVDSALVGKEGPFETVIATRPNREKPALPRGSVGLYGTEQAQKFKLCQDVKNDRNEVLEHYNLSPVALEGDRLRGEKIKSVRIDLAGAIDESLQQKLKGQLKEVRSRKENTVFFVLECSGGKAKVAREIADEIRDLQNEANDKVWTVAFIPNRAPDLATFIAFACSEIIMYRGSDESKQAVLGDFEGFISANSKGGDPSNTTEFIRRNLGEIAEQKGYSKLIVEGLIDRDSSIVVVRDKKKPAGTLDLMTERQFDAARKDKDKDLQLIKRIKQAGSYLKINASLAKELRLVQNTVDNPDVKEVFSLYGVEEKSVRDSKPGWLDDFAAFVRRTEVSILLVIVAFAGLILEFKMPGATIPGLVALICFVLFFWAHAYANGQTVYLAIAMFVVGLILLGIELFILPGFGVSGIGGVLLILTGIGLATLEKAPSSSDEWREFAERVMTYGVTLVAAGVLSLVFARYLPKIPYANRLMLAPPSEIAGMDAEPNFLPGAELAAGLLGQVGTATSMLRPAGMARFGDQYVDVVTEGDFIQPETPIQVVEVEGTRIVVKKV